MPKKPYQPFVDIPQALSLCALLIDFELEEPQITPIPPNWQKELKQARQVITSLLADYHPLPQDVSV